MERAACRKRRALRQLIPFIGFVLVCSVVCRSGKRSDSSSMSSVYFYSTAHVSVKPPPRITDLRPSEAATAEEGFRPLLKTTNNGRTCILAFSAYLDERFKMVKILTDVDRAWNNVTSVTASCLIWYRSQGEPYATTLRFDYFATHLPNRTQRVGVVYGCDIHPSRAGSPYAVSVVAKNAGMIASDVTTIHLSSYSSVTPTVTFAVCTPPLFGKIRPQAVAEFVEIHRLLGAEVFFFYNVSIPPSVGKLLASYASDGIAKIIQFQSVYPDKVFYNNQAIMQLDCMYRNRGKARYVAQMDVDEILMPGEKYDNWTYLTRSTFGEKSAALIFLNRFFSLSTSLQCSAHHESALPDGVPKSLKRLSYHDYYYPSRVRSKFIYSPERVKRVGTHYVVPLNGYAVVVLNTTDEGVLHHYRDKLQMLPPSLNITAVDRRACTFRHLLLKHLSTRLSLI